MSTNQVTVRTNKTSFGRWAKTVGWKHIIAWMMIVYATFPILYIISTSLTDFGGIENAALFQQFHYQNYIDLFNDPSYPFAQWKKYFDYRGLYCDSFGIYLCLRGICI